MATSAKAPKKTKTTSTTYDKDYADNLITENYQKGVKDGQQQIWNNVAVFLQTRMNTYFEARQDELAKECREILLLIKPNIQ